MDLLTKIFNETKPRQEQLSPIQKLGHSDLIYQEQFKALRAKLESKLDANGMKVVAVTSAIASEGKTMSTANLAMNIASAGRKKVLLIDTDLRKADLSSGLGIPQTPGVGEYLEDMATIHDICRSGFSPGLDIIPAGKVLSDPSVLLGGKKFRRLLGTTREQYDVIILDTSPILPVADTLSLRDSVDGFILVFRISATPYTLLKQALEEMGDAKIVGVVLNGTDPRKYKYYQKYYGKYYHKTTEETISR